MRGAWFAFVPTVLVIVAACVSEPAYVPPPSPSDLPRCPRVVEHAYDPDAATTTTAAAPSPKTPGADDREVLAEARSPGAGKAAAPPKHFARAQWKPAPRAPLPANATTCGDKKNPCPLQRWMREHVAPAVAANDAAALAKALARAATFSPDRAWTWAAMSNEAAEAARRGDIPAARTSCRACHTAYKALYLERYRLRKVE